MPDDFKQTIEQIKLRNPIEDVVRERVPGLRRAGALWVACCPFHEEKTPSFKVDPRRGTWHCYGACGIGGDQLSFVQRAYNVEFREALEILAGRAGVQLPERNPREAAVQEQNDELTKVLARAEEYYHRLLRRPEGARALEYVRQRGLSDATIDAFGVGFAPAGGRDLVGRAGARGVSLDQLASVGLARTDSEGRAWDFFQGRLMIPVRDLKGRTVGFGARRLSDEDKRAPKYINTPETALFHKGRVIYALDRALEHVRKNGHLVLVEGYTDVMAAHQVGLRGFVAVLGTATTEEHAALVRRTGARRVSLLFDGDDAGRKATWRALDGLLGLDVVLDVVRMVGDKDPCELVTREGAAPLEALLEKAVDWFEFLISGVRAVRPDERWREIDRVLGLIARIPRPLVRDERIAQLSRALETPVDGLRAQYESLPERRREAERLRRAKENAPTPAPVRRDRRAEALSCAFRDLAGAALLEPRLAPEAVDFASICPDPPVQRLLCELARQHAAHGDACSVDSLFNALEDDAARDLIVPLLDDAGRASGPRDLFDGAVRFIHNDQAQHSIDALNAQRASGELEENRLRELHRELRARTT